jgi:hypothetical protein
MRRKRKESSFSEEKEAKRLLFLRSFPKHGVCCAQRRHYTRNKSLFASFSSEKEESFLFSCYSFSKPPAVTFAAHSRKGHPHVGGIAF